MKTELVSGMEDEASATDKRTDLRRGQEGVREGKEEVYLQGWGRMDAEGQTEGVGTRGRQAGWRQRALVPALGQTHPGTPAPRGWGIRGLPPQRARPSLWATLPRLPDPRTAGQPLNWPGGQPPQTTGFPVSGGSTRAPSPRVCRLWESHRI